MNFKIKFAEKEDFDLLIAFIDKQWEENHIFVKSKKLFDWQYFNKNSNNYNFLIGICNKTNQILGILGFIPFNHYDNQIDDLCWMSLWKVHERAKGLGLGKSLLLELQKKFKGQLYTIGANERTIPIYKSMGLTVGKLNHFFLINPNLNKFKLIKFSSIPSHTFKVDEQKKLDKISKSDIINSFKSFKPSEQYPFKSANYIINRYIKHPFYDYFFYKISKDLNILGLLIVRKCSYKESKALRIIDFIGPSNILRGLYNEWCKILNNNNAEYLDFYNYGLKYEDLMNSGFTLSKKKEIIIPNHFEPFEKKNVDINFMFPSLDNKNFRIVKGDSDQDRPNILREKNE